MLFKIKRTSKNKGDQPCEEAFLRRYLQHSYVYMKNMPKMGNAALREWYASGINHRTVEEKLVKDIGDAEGWFVSFDSVEEFLAFYKKYGKLVILPSEDTTDWETIEIYDDWRE